MIGYCSSDRAASNAADQSTPSRPPDACRIEMKQLTQIADGAADHNIVVAEKQPTESRDAGCDDKRDSRMGLDRGEGQFIGLAE